jgi:outer membrane cobalamin receptor
MLRIKSLLRPFHVSGPFLILGLAACISSNQRMQSAVDPRARGRFFTREDIRVSNRTSLADLLRTVPGARVTQQSDGGVQVQFARCRGSTLPRGNAVARDQGTQVFINGMKVQDPVGEIGALRLSYIEAIAVYRGPAELPADAVGNGCAAIVIRTSAIHR